jgi:hypothetical protein
LLERAAQLSSQAGGGSATALVLAEASQHHKANRNEHERALFDSVLGGLGM